jgi:segregation and condensation protein A
MISDDLDKDLAIASSSSEQTIAPTEVLAKEQAETSGLDVENSPQKKSKNQTHAPMDKLWEDPDKALSEKSLMIDLEGFEGPLDLLLHLARNQKVDLAKISVLALAEQYLAFVENARKIRLELAADYLVMAAWLAFLKSKLLIPQVHDGDEESGEDMAQALAFRLKRLEAMREAASRLINRNRLGRDVFVRGSPEPIVIDKTSDYTASLYDLLTAYASQRQRNSLSLVTIERRKVWSLKDARAVLRKMIGELKSWTALDQFLLQYLHENDDERRTALASSFAASLEMVREGQLDIRQDGVFAPIFLRNSLRNKTSSKADDINIAS